MFGLDKIARFLNQPLYLTAQPKPDLSGYALWAQLDSLRGKHVEMKSSRGATIEGRFSGYQVKFDEGQITLLTEDNGGIVLNTLELSYIGTTHGKDVLVVFKDNTVLTVKMD